jgi:predicted MPP superfamily phosphohydrolase
MRRPLAAGAGLVTGVAAWAFLIEPRIIRVRHVELCLPRWSAELDGLRVALVADLHAGGPHIDEDAVTRVVERVNHERPDMIALLGDFVDPTVALGGRVPPQAVAARLTRLEAPLGSWAVLGNHDWKHEGELMPRALEDRGITVLENDAVPIGVDGLWAVGLADLALRRVDLEAALTPVPDDATVLVLAHNPDVFRRVPERVALTVAGHTHNSQVNVPGLRRLAIPSHFGLRYSGGHVVEDGRHLYVSAGIGEAGIPARLGAPPEITILHLRGG